MASQRLRRSLRGALATGLVAAGLALVPSAPAVADPVPPDNATEAQQQLAELGHEAEVVTEQLHDAQIALDTRLAEEQAARARFESAQQELTAALAQQAEFRGTVDQLTAASYQGARLNRLSALMTSTSPQELLDQMSGLELLASDTTAQLAVFRSSSEAAAMATSDAETATAAAQRAKDEAQAVQADLVGKQVDLKTRTDAVQAQYAALSVAEQASYAGATTPVGFTPPPPPAASESGPVSAADSPSAGARDSGSSSAAAPGSDSVAAPAPSGTGSGSGYGALQAALTKLGSPYAWGATGPNSFDCSGLTSWAFGQVGVSIPRSSGAQAGSGTAVSRDQLQPGDLVFFYSPVSHVGIYAGDGNVVHASTYGQPVKVAPMGQMPFNSARRY